MVAKTKHESTFDEAIAGHGGISLDTCKPDPFELLGPLHDAHCHLDFMSNGEEVARRAHADGLRLFANTVTPDGFEQARIRFDALENVYVGLGMHPWWVDDVFDAVAFEQLARKTQFIGEVGLDFGKKGEANREAQVDAFAQIATICAHQGAKLLSIHAVRSVETVLDILERAGTLATCTCVFHWFSGTSDELARALRAGCYFSVNPMMLETRKGREYVRQLPVERLLVETDAPPGENVEYEYAELVDGLANVRRIIEGKRSAS